MIKGVYRVAGPDITDRRDCNVYVLHGEQSVLIDCGFGASIEQTIDNIEAAGIDPAAVGLIILTHCHVDHIGGAPALRDRLGAPLCMHELDADIVERGDNRLTAAFCFELSFEPFTIDIKVSGGEGRIPMEGEDIFFLHTPGHTPGSISPYVDAAGKRILFGQDLGAPLLDDFDCDAAAWHASMARLLALEADVLCDGHSGIYQPAHRVAAYIRRFIKLYSSKPAAPR